MVKMSASIAALENKKESAEKFQKGCDWILFPCPHVGRNRLPTALIDSAACLELDSCIICCGFLLPLGSIALITNAAPVAIKPCLE